MAEQIEQLMRQVKLGGMAKGWRSVPYENTEQYVTDLLTLELQERETNRINRMVKTAGFRVMKTLDDFVWNSAIELPGGLTQEYMTDLHFLAPKENLIFSVIPLIRQGEHHGEKPLGFQGQAGIFQVVVAHHGVVPCALYAKNCHIHHSHSERAARPWGQPPYWLRFIDRLGMFIHRAAQPV